MVEVTRGVLLGLRKVRHKLAVLGSLERGSSVLTLTGGLLRVTGTGREAHAAVNITDKADRLLVTGALHNAVLQTVSHGLLENRADIAVKEGRAEVEHTLFDKAVARQLVLVNVNDLQRALNLLVDSVRDIAPLCELRGGVVNDPLSAVSDILHINLGQQGVRIAQVTVNVLNDSLRHNAQLIVCVGLAGAGINDVLDKRLLHIAGLHALNKSVIEIRLLLGQLAVTALRQNRRVVGSVDLGEIVLNLLGDGIVKILPRLRHLLLIAGLHRLSNLKARGLLVLKLNHYVNLL